MAVTVLAGDIGGTKTILRLAEVLQPPGPAAGPAMETLHEERYASQGFPDLVPMVQHFLRSAAELPGHLPLPEKACFGIAGPVVGTASELTNLGWMLDAGRLSRELGIARVRLINDFSAVGYGIAALGAADLVTLQSGAFDPQAPRALIGAGTGLGQGFVVPVPGGGFRAFPSEGSHADFAPRSHREFQLLDFLREQHQIPRISAERVISGRGIISIYEFLRAQAPLRESPALAELHCLWQRQIGTAEKTVDFAAEISRAALAGSDDLCRDAMTLFIEAYGAEAGNLCLKLLPDGGLYVAGGIAPKILPLLQAGAFMKAFRDKGRMSSRMEKIPVHVIMNHRVGLMGAALCAAGLDDSA